MNMVMCNLYEILLIILMLVKVAKCEVNYDLKKHAQSLGTSKSSMGHPQISNQTQTQKKNNDHQDEDGLFTRIFKIISHNHKGQNQINEPHPTESSNTSSSSSSSAAAAESIIRSNIADTNPIIDLELERANNVNKEDSQERRRSDLLRTTIKTTLSTSTTTLAPPSSSSTQPPITVIIEDGEDWPRMAAPNTYGEKEETSSSSSSSSSSKVAMNNDINARVNKQLNFQPDTIDSSNIYSPKADYESSTTQKTWYVPEKQIMDNNDNNNLSDDFSYDVTTPTTSGLYSDREIMTTERSSDILDNNRYQNSNDFLKTNTLQAGFKPLKQYDMMLETATSMAPTRRPPKVRGTNKNREPSQNQNQNQIFPSSQYNAWRSDIIKQKPYLWHDVSLIRDHRAKQQLANIVATEPQPEGSEEDSIGTRKPSYNGGVYLQQLNQATAPIHQHQQQQQQYQSVNDILRNIDRGGTTRLDPNTVLLGTSSSATSSLGPTSANLIDSSSRYQQPLQDLQNQPQTIQISAIPTRGLNNQVVRLNGPVAGLNTLGYNPGYNGLLPNTLAGGGNGYLDAFGRQIVMVNQDRRRIDWSFWIWPVIALISLPLVLGALFVPIFLKSIVILIQVLQSLGLLLPFSLTQQLAQAATGVLAVSSAAQAEQVKT